MMVVDARMRAFSQYRITFPLIFEASESLSLADGRIFGGESWNSLDFHRQHSVPRVTYPLDFDHDRPLLTATKVVDSSLNCPSNLINHTL